MGSEVGRHGVAVIAYCLMTNHFHLLLRCDDGGLSEVMHGLCAKYVRRFNDRVGRDGPLFRARFLSKPVDSWAYRVRVARYIHLNPRDLGRPEPLAEYRWSSYGAYVGRRPTPRWLDPAPILSVHGHDPETYRQSVEVAADPIDPSPDDLLGLLDVIVGEVGGLDAGARRSMVRNVAVALLDHVDAGQRDRLVARLGFSSADSERAARKRARAFVARPVAADLLARLRAA